MSASSPLLLSVDLEDDRRDARDAATPPDRVPAMVHRYLAFFRQRGARATFFTVGAVARAHPSLVREIAAEGHELACHGDTHTVLTELGPAAFAEDLARNVDALVAAGAPRPVGFRSPVFSLVERTRWAHDALANAGFRYSSSVLPAKNPLFGWPGFPRRPTRLECGLVEIPVTVGGLPGLRVPFAGGVYLRALPPLVLEGLARSCRRAGSPLVAYVHPYDIDVEQEPFRMHDNRFFDWLLHANRDTTLAKLDRLIRKHATQRYGEYAEGLRLEA
jgi:polysaccharide deacetylase family protein (PEP-CTERM system associated)